MPRALTREEQAILALVRQTGAALPVPELAQRLSLDTAVAQAACEYLVERGLVRASVYAVAPAKVPAAGAPAVTHGH